MAEKPALKWNLNDILKENDFDNCYKEIEVDIEKLNGYLKTLKPEISQKDFIRIISFSEKLKSKYSRIAYLPHLMESVDQKDQKAKLLKSKADNLYVDFSKTIRKLNHWIKGKKIEGIAPLDDKNAKRLFEVSGDLKDMLCYQRQAARYALEEKEETIISSKDINGISVLKDLRELIETEFEYKLKVKSQKSKVIKTQSELLALVYNPKAEIREAAYRALFEKQKDNLDKFFMIYQAVVKDWSFEAKLRGFNSPIEMRNFDNQVSNKTIEVLLDVCSRNRKVFQRFFKYKAKELKMGKLSRFDLYAPLQDSKQKISFDKALLSTRKVLNSFSPKFGQLISRVVEEKHIDSHPGITKRSGAFCATVNPDVTPYVLLNYTGKIRDVYTLAHELGHAAHSLYAQQHSHSVQQANLPLAETASTLAEMIMFEKLYQQETNAKTKKYMLMEKMADTYATVLRQNYFVIFENRAHEAIMKGITADQLSEMWLQTLKEQFEDSIDLDPMFKYEWSYIPHITHTPFYCYAYNFGELLSLSLYRRYKKEGSTFVPKIEKILEAGGSEDSSELLKNIGIDIESEKFWQESFDLIANWQDELERF